MPALLSLPAARRHAAALALVLTTLAGASGQAIDRHALVSRHRVERTEHTPIEPLTVGNGEFAFNFDFTGLQTFPGVTPGEPPLTTMAQWAWHASPESREADYAVTLRDYDAHGRAVSYSTDWESRDAKLIRASPHRFSLGRIALRMTHADGTAAEADELAEPRQVLDLWSGLAISSFRFDGQPVRVMTVAHPEHDAVAVRIESPLVATGRVAIEVSFAYPSAVWGPGVDDWRENDTRHTTRLVRDDEGARFERRLDADVYLARVTTDADIAATADPHRFLLESSGEALVATFHFAAEDTPPLPFDEVNSASEAGWKNFWTSGGAIDLSGSADPRWRELERRIVLSQYLTAIHCAGSLPPQETGLFCNSWHGKSHLEMHWWHAAHFAPWGRFGLAERSLDYYRRILPAARRIAERQGYDGARWPKMTGPRGVSSPSPVGELLIWQQPHPIWFAEQAYRLDPSDETLRAYLPIVEATADFMASYAHDDGQRCVLGPVLVAAQESYNGRQAPGVLNPTFEVAYWRWALRTANAWRERLGDEPDTAWAAVAERIAKPPTRDGIYMAIETAPQLIREDHPSMLCALGVLPDVGLIDRATMSRTLDSVTDEWDWPSTWGWDYPVAAMTATRLGRPDDAIDLLLMGVQKNRCGPGGHYIQADRLPAYLPGNGGLLYATAMMAAGWDGLDESVDAPGFPKGGAWSVRHEGLRRDLIP